MTIAHCPKCREQVSVPGGASRQARVRCPLCSDEYLLDDALRPLPPLLIVVDDPEAESIASINRSPPSAPVFAGADEGDAPAIVMDEASDDFSLTPSSPVIARPFKFEPGSAVPAARNATRPRTRRKQGSPLRMMVQTVGGGVMGLVLAQLILWWVPGNWNATNRDPFGLAAKVTPYAPFLVPIALQGNAPTARADGATTERGLGSSRTGTSSVAGDNAGRKTSGGFESNIPESNSDAPSDTTKLAADRNKKNKEKKESPPNQDEFPLTGLYEPDATKAPAKEADPFAVPDVTSEPITAKSKTKEDMKKETGSPIADADAVPAAVSAAKPTLDEPVGLRNPPAIKVEEITSRLADVASADLAWDTAENPTREKKYELITDLYVKLAQLGDTLASSGAAKAEAAEALQPVVERLNALAGQSEKLVPLGRLAVLLNDRSENGAVLYGVVLSHQPRGKMIETQIRLFAKSDPVVTVVNAVDAGEQLPANTNVLVLGRWISNPKEQLAGYEGDANSVLLHGIHVTVPQANTNRP